MKKLFLCLLLLLGLCAPVQAAPYLVCDWVPGMESSEVEVNGVVVAGTVTQAGTSMRLLDLAGYANGGYTFKARFIGVGGWPSEWSVPFEATKPVAIGGGLRIER